MSNGRSHLRDMQAPELNVQKYERYLPSAFDESLSILEKINQIIYHTNKNTELSEEMLTKWNEVYHWVMNEGLDNAIGYRLVEWLETGRFDDILGEILLKDYVSIKELDSLLNNKRTNVEKLNVTVGVDGDFPTLNKCFEHVSTIEKIRSNYSQFIVKITDGTVLKEQLFFDGEDYSYITITSDSIISVDSNHFKEIIGYDERLHPFISGINNSKLPKIDALFKMIGNKEWNVGVLLDNQSTGVITSGSGVTHTSGFGLRLMNNASAFAEGSIWSHSEGRACLISQGSTLHAPRIDLSYAKGRNAFRAYGGCSATIKESNMSYCGEQAVRISEGSHVDMQGSNLTHTGTVNSEKNGHALNVYGSSIVYANNCDVSFAVGDGFRISDSSNVSINGGSKASNCGGVGVRAFNNATVNASDIVVENCSDGGVYASSLSRVQLDRGRVSNNGGEADIIANYGATINITNVVTVTDNVAFRSMNGSTIVGSNPIADNSYIGFSVYLGSISVSRASAKNTKYKGVQVSTNSTFKSISGDYSGAKDIGVHGFRGSDISLYGDNCRRSNVDSPNDIVATSSTTVRLANVIGGTNTPTNNITSNGIIIR